ncbi:peptide chain release factor N(5)-glutamine methyltransferase [bacterium]|nr:peptide chain release factor N(5)-glutamine methyltransferase [bacterium]
MKTGRRKNSKPPKVLDAVKLSEEYLARYDIESPRLNAEYLLAKARNCTRMDLYLDFDSILGDGEMAVYREDLLKRSQHYPLQYILGETEFFSIMFRVREGVFIPRPETEILIERVDALLGEKSSVRFLEFGLGTGVISATLAMRHKNWRGVGFDISRKAVELARENFDSLGVSDRIQSFVASTFDVVVNNQRFDLLISNPPYIPTDEIDTLQKEVSCYENRTALDGGKEGKDFYPLLVNAGLYFLNPGGMLAVETGDNLASYVESIFGKAGYKRVETSKDYNDFKRIVTAFRPD